MHPARLKVRKIWKRGKKRTSPKEKESKGRWENCPISEKGTIKPGHQEEKNQVERTGRGEPKEELRSTGAAVLRAEESAVASER